MPEPVEHQESSAFSPHGLRILHWPLAFTMLLLLFTGFCLHAGAQPGWSLFRVYPAWLPTLRAQMWHFILAALFTASLVPSIVLYLASWRRSRSWGGYRILHLLLIFGGLLMVVTGIVLTRTVASRGLYTFVRGAHLFGSIVTCAAYNLHLAFGFTIYSKWLVPAFAPWRSPQWYQLVWPIVILPIAALIIFNSPISGQHLVAGKITLEPGELAQLPWEDAKPLFIPLANGAHFDRGVTGVTLKALHNGTELFVYASWRDQTESRIYTPWERRRDGWEHLTGIPKDEYAFYEDKFSLIFPIEESAGFNTIGCAYACHLGGGMPFGYKASPRKIDVWHWKATRTDPVGQADDKWWWNRDPDNSDYGRFGDPKTGGGYTKNLNPDGTAPAYLPTGDDAEHRGGILREKSAPYSDERMRSLPEGTLVPGVVISPFEGDRADVSSYSTHHHNRWHVYLRRKLDTGSPYDREFLPGIAIPFGCAAFDNAAKRHAYNHRVYLLLLDKSV